MTATATVKFKFPNKPLFRSRGFGAIRVIAEETIRAMTKAGKVVEREAQEEAPRVFSDLARSIFSEITFKPLMATIMPHVEYAYVVHEGRRPGRRPPAAPLQLWARQKFGLGESEAWSAAFRIQKKIANKGTEGNPFMTRALDRSESTIESIWDDARDVVARRLS